MFDIELEVSMSSGQMLQRALANLERTRRDHTLSGYNQYALVHGIQLALCFHGNIELGIYDVEAGSFSMPECTYAYVFYVANPSQKFYLHL